MATNQICSAAAWPQRRWSTRDEGVEGSRYFVGMAVLCTDWGRPGGEGEDGAPDQEKLENDEIEQGATRMIMMLGIQRPLSR